jgi:hypothetical protein
MRSRSVVVGLAWWCVALAPNWAAADDLRMEISARSGLLFPFGHVRTSQTIADFGPCAPVWLDFGVYPDRHWYLGGYAAYAPCLVPRMPSTDTRLGVELRFHSAGQDGATHTGWWVGMGAGYEHLGLPDIRSADTHMEPNTENYGIEFARLSTGLDLIAPPVSLGPFASFSTGSFVRYAVPYGPGGTTGVGDGLHAWLALGLRIAYAWSVSASAPRR